MKTRCLNPNSKDFAYYGARGIRVCERWASSFANFLADMGKAPTTQHQLDRIDNSGNYEPANCRWATRAENSRNRRSSLLLTHNGITKSATEWAMDIGLNRHGVAERIRKGWSVEDAVTKAAIPRAERRSIALHRV